jgi:hypothetical protein
MNLLSALSFFGFDFIIAEFVRLISGGAVCIRGGGGGDGGGNETVDSEASFFIF